MKAIARKLPLAAAAAATLAGAACVAWLFTREGTVGLYQWTIWRGRLNAIMAAFAAPAALALAWLLARSRSRRAPGGAGAAPGRLERALGAATAALGLLVLAGVAALWIGLASIARQMSGPPPKLNLVDPVSGIAPDPRRGGSVLLSFSSDPHWGVDTANPGARLAVLRSVADLRPDAFFPLGDQVEQGMYEGPWREAAEAYASVLGGLPIRPLMGNHDSVIDGQAHFERFFFPDRSRSGTGSPLYYSIDAGPVRLFVVNLLWREESFGRAQRAWLDSSLAALPPGVEAVVLSHCFAYSSGYVDEETGLWWRDDPGVIAALSPILERNKVALHISGHNHYLELLEKNGVTYAVVGGMGGKPDPEPAYASPASVWRAPAGTFGRLDLLASAEGLRLAFVDRDGKLLREAAIPKRR